MKGQFLDFLHTCSVCTEHQTMLKTRVYDRITCTIGDQASVPLPSCG